MYHEGKKWLNLTEDIITTYKHNHHRKVKRKVYNYKTSHWVQQWAKCILLIWSIHGNQSQVAVLCSTWYCSMDLQGQERIDGRNIRLVFWSLWFWNWNTSTFSISLYVCCLHTGFLADKSAISTPREAKCRGLGGWGGVGRASKAGNKQAVQVCDFSALFWP